jgi:hypothetical protein
MADWKYKTYLGDVFQDDDMPLLEKRDTLVQRIKSTTWYEAGTRDDDYSELWWIIDELADVEDENHFNLCWEALYDYCDAELIWLDVWKGAPV